MVGSEAFQTMLSAIKEKEPSYNMPTTDSGTNDYWTLAKDYCNKVQNGAHIPSASDLAKIARVLYNDTSISDADEYNDNYSLNWNTNKTAVFAALGIESTASHFHLWSDKPDGTEYAYAREFTTSSTHYGYDFPRGNSDFYRVVCISD